MVFTLNFKKAAKIFLLLKNLDWILAGSIFLLSIIGLVEIYSIALGQGTALSMLNFKKQLIFFAFGLMNFFFFAFLDFRQLKTSSRRLYIFGLIVLIIVLFSGYEVHGTKGWFKFGSFSIQPIEFIKIILIIFLAKYFSNNFLKNEPLKHFLISAGGVLVFCGLILAQPDLGSAFILFFIWLFLIFNADFKLRYLFFVFFSVLILFWLSWLFYLKDYQKERVLTFLNPNNADMAQSYNVNQATIAIGSGGLAGRGIGFGSQSQLRFLPESQTDFIFSVIAEETGFLGVSFILFLFSLFFYRCLIILRKTKDSFSVFFILGTIGLLFIEIFINIGMNLGLVPVIGIPLPFLSYGGSSLIASFILAGIVESVAIDNL